MAERRGWLGGGLRFRTSELKLTFLTQQIVDTSEQIDSKGVPYYLHVVYKLEERPPSCPYRRANGTGPCTLSRLAAWALSSLEALDDMGEAHSRSQGAQIKMTWQM